MKEFIYYFSSYDISTQRRVSETFHFDFNDAQMMGLLGSQPVRICSLLCVCVRACVLCVRVHARMRACVRACVRVLCVRVRVLTFVFWSRAWCKQI